MKNLTSCRRILSILCCIITVSLLGGCATTPKPLIGIIPGKSMETLQSSVALSVHAQDKITGGRGVLVFKKPDRFRLAVLSPFGPPILEVFVDGDLITCLLPGKGIAYSGTFADLPDKEGLRSWTLMHWVVERPPASGPAIYREFTRPDGSREKVYFDQRGVVERKVNGSGDEVIYEDYQVVAGIAFPTVIEMMSRDGNRVRLTFEEPELNVPMEDAVLKPELSNVKILPIAAFPGF